MMTITLGWPIGCRVTAILGIILFAASGRAPATAAEADDPPAGYLFAHMMNDDYGRLYYSISTDGLHWSLLNRGRRVLEDYRGHPDLMRGRDGRWILTGNAPARGDVRFWVSSNLVTWMPLRDFVPDMSAFPGYEGPDRWHGAPKLFYDEATRQYLLTWHFSNAAKLREKPENYWSGMRTFYVTSPDLVSFSRAARLFSFDLATIDVIVRREGTKYFAILKDERYPSFEWPTGKTLRISAADHLLGPYAPPGPPVSPNFREAPALIPRPDGRGWYLYFEQYPGLSYLPATASTLRGPWHDVYAPDCRTPEGARHGCMIALRKPEFDAVTTAYGRTAP